MESKLRAVHDVLQGIDDCFREGAWVGRQVILYDSSLLFDDERPLSEHITEALSAVKELLSPEDDIKIVSRSQKKYIWQNQWGNWNGYCGRRRVEQFGRNECAAKIWLDQFPPEERRS